MTRRYRPSSMGRIIACPPSAVLPQVNEPASTFANSGTAQHTLNEICLRLEVKPEDCRGDTISVFDDDGNEVDRFIVDQERIDCAKYFLDYCESVDNAMKTLHGESVRSLTEHHIVAANILPNFRGTIDRLYYSDEPNSSAFIVDYKHGAGVKVVAEDNPQLKAYALLVVEKFKQVSCVAVAIVQPRCYGDKITTAEFSIDDLREYERQIRETRRDGNAYSMRRAGDEETLALVNPGDHCRWCPAKKSCPKKDQIPKSFGSRRAATSAEDDFSHRISKGN